MSLCLGMPLFAWSRMQGSGWSGHLGLDCCHGDPDKWQKIGNDFVTSLLQSFTKSDKLPQVISYESALIAPGDYEFEKDKKKKKNSCTVK